MLAGVGVGLKKTKLGQKRKMYQFIKSMIVGLSRISRYGLPGWGPPDNHNYWLEALSKVALNWSR